MKRQKSIIQISLINEEERNMEKQKTITKTMREVGNLVIKFFKPFGLKEPILAIPKEVKKMQYKLGFMEFFSTAISLAFAFLLKVTNIAIEAKLILLGIILFMLYKGQEVVREALINWQSIERQKFNLIFQDEIVLKGSELIGRVSDRVMKFDKSSNLYRIMDNESILNTIKNYLSNVWRQKVQHIFDILEILSIFGMLIVAIVTNNEIPQVIFIPLIIIFSIVCFFAEAYVSMNRHEYYEKHRKYNNEQSVLVNDLLRVPIIVPKDLQMRIEKYQESVIESNENIKNFHQKRNWSNFVSTVLETLSQYGIIIIFLFGIQWNEITLATITEIAATLVIVETAMGYIRNITYTLNSHNEAITVIEKEENDMLSILEIYHQEEDKINQSETIESIQIRPFNIKYMEESENDKPFELMSKQDILIKKGEIAILTGASGSGKSTFMKLLTQRIRVEKSIDIPNTSRYLFYDEKMKLGSLSIFEEIFCGEKNPNLEKMQEILENLHLWGEIKSNCIDLWKWMKEKRYGHTLSNGQNQRLILAKILYWLDDEIDVIVLDECTSGLDDKSNTDSADAERILEYIVKYCNQDKERIIIISTHQNLDGFKKKINNNIRQFHFCKKEKCNLITEI